MSASASSSPRSSTGSLLPPPTQPAKPRSALPVDHALGAALVLLSVLLHGAANASARYATHTLHISVLTMSLVRGLSQAAVALCLLLSAIDPRAVFSTLDPRARRFLALRGLLGGLVLYLKYAALAALPVTTAAALQCTAPFFTAVSAALVLAEAPTARDGLALSLTLAGATAVARAAPTPGTVLRVSAIAAAIASAACSSAAILVVRATALRVHFVLNVLCIGVATALIPLIVHTVDRRNLTVALRDLVAPLAQLSRLGVASLAAACGFAVVGTLCFNRGIQLLPAAKSALLRTFDIPVNFVSGCIMLGEMPTGGMHITGCIFITLSTYITATKASAPTTPKAGLTQSPQLARGVSATAYREGRAALDTHQSDRMNA